MKNKLIIIFVGIIALASGLFIQSNYDFKKNNTAIEFSLPDLSGKQRHISEWKDKILIINFWATWCPPCIREIPSFIRIQHQLTDKEVQFIGIAVDNKEAVIDYLKTIKLNYPILIGGESAINLSQQLGNIIKALPFTVILDQQGKIILQQPGEITKKEIMETVLPILKTGRKTL